MIPAKESDEESDAVDQGDDDGDDDSDDDAGEGGEVVKQPMIQAKLDFWKASIVELLDAFEAASAKGVMMFLWGFHFAFYPAGFRMARWPIRILPSKKEHL